MSLMSDLSTAADDHNQALALAADHRYRRDCLIHQAHERGVAVAELARATQLSVDDIHTVLGSVPDEPALLK